MLVKDWDAERKRAATHTRPYDTRCPRCAAPRGSTCRTLLNGAVTAPHKARVARAAR